MKRASPGATPLSGLDQCCRKQKAEYRRHPFLLILIVYSINYFDRMVRRFFHKEIPFHELNRELRMHLNTVIDLGEEHTSQAKTTFSAGAILSASYASGIEFLRSRGQDVHQPLQLLPIVLALPFLRAARIRRNFVSSAREPLEKAQQLINERKIFEDKNKNRQLTLPEKAFAYVEKRSGERILVISNKPGTFEKIRRWWRLAKSVEGN